VNEKSGKLKFVSGSLLLSLFLTINPLTVFSVEAANVKSGSFCKAAQKNKTITSGNSKLKCISSGGKFRWTIQKAPSKTKSQEIAEISLKPTFVPGLVFNLEDSRVTAKVSIDSKSEALIKNCREVEAIFSTTSAGATRIIGTKLNSIEEVNFTRNITFTYWIDIKQINADKVFVQVSCKNEKERGEPSIASIVLPSNSSQQSDSKDLANAKRMAASYLSLSSYSRTELINLLVAQGFNVLDAQLAVDAQNISWREQAAATAADYMKIATFSYAVLLQQLESAGFSREEAIYGVESSGLKPSSPSPAPTSKPLQDNQSSTGCVVTYLNPLPIANQRIAIIGIDWEKDAKGYVIATLRMRNDNSMALRLVNFVFSFFHKGTLVKTSSTLEGDHHFFIQDDAKFNSLNGPSGAWLPDQTRSFRIPTNQILDCSSITVVSSGFLVKQGIGAN
jgi:hypothetical protein